MAASGSFEWLFEGYPTGQEVAPGIVQVAAYGRLWLAPILVVLLIIPAALRYQRSDPRYARWLMWAGGIGLGYLFLQGFAIGIGGWRSEALLFLFGPVDAQFGMGYGALLVTGAFPVCPNQRNCRAWVRQR